MICVSIVYFLSTSVCSNSAWKVGCYSHRFWRKFPLCTYPLLSLSPLCCKISVFTISEPCIFLRVIIRGNILRVVWFQIGLAVSLTVSLERSLALTHFALIAYYMIIPKNFPKVWCGVRDILCVIYSSVGCLFARELDRSDRFERVF